MAVSQPTQQPDPAPAPPSATTRPPVLPVLGCWAALMLAATVVATLASRNRGPDLPLGDGRSWIGAWLEGDANWYQSIATGGYFYVPGQQSSIAFFPTYPMTVRGVGLVLGGDYHLAGWLVATLAGAGVVVAFTVWVWPRLPRPAAITAVAVMLLYPYSFFLYGAMYSDSLYILLVLCAFLLVERRQYWAAGLVGALATAGRPVGVAVAAGLVVRTLEQLAQDRLVRRSARTVAADGPPAASDPAGDVPPNAPAGTGEIAPAGTGEVAPTGIGPARDRVPAGATARRWWPARPGWRDLVRAVPLVRWREIGVLVSGLGLAAWCIYLWTTFGDPVAFATVQSAPGWYQASGPKTWFKVVYVGTMLVGPVDVAIRLTAQALMMLIALLLLRRVWRLFGWGYLAYTVVALAIPLLGTKDFMGTGRYVLAAFPVLAAAGHVLATTPHRWIRPVVLAALGAGMLLAAYTFGSGIAVT